MEPEESLIAFLGGSLGTKRERILDFVARPKTRRKFMDMLYHQLGEYFDRACLVSALPETAWRQPAFRFSPPSDFGVVVASLRQAHQQLDQPELVITQDGRYGFWRDETYVDLEMLVVARPTGG